MASKDAKDAVHREMEAMEQVEKLDQVHIFKRQYLLLCNDTVAIPQFNWSLVLLADEGTSTQFTQLFVHSTGSGPDVAGAESG